MRRCVADGGWGAAVGGAVTVAVDATGVAGSAVFDCLAVGGTLDCFVADFCVAVPIEVRVAAGGVPDGFVAALRVAVLLEVRVANGVFARLVAVTDVGVSLGAAGTIVLGLTVEFTSATSAVVGAFTDGN
jgi:hypothetical protein